MSALVSPPSSSSLPSLDEPSLHNVKATHLANEDIKTGSKDDADFRTYDQLTTPERVVEHYRLMRSKQTVEFYDRMAEKYKFEEGTGVGRRKMTIEQAFKELESYVDASDPDLDLPNLLHLLQTAEGIRSAGHPEWLQLTGLLHDMGKIMFLWGTGEDGQDGYDPKGQQWALGGDTFVVGCSLPDEGIVFPEFNSLNPDMSDSRYNSKFGIYQPGCGLDRLKIAWGHDEYMYRMLSANKARLPKEGLDMVRYHSFYPWHAEGCYRHLLGEGDEETMEWVKLFNQFDLYTKDEGNEIDVEEVWPYYKGLLDKYGLGGELWW
mmetsp:Transcript_30034/g.59651  ORF Transcript_30034/g.59651 Transcript_30034/m.59651 type:complete len:320 (-) Transcript_30034:8-967(-)|eukprot:CAMPEP_0182462162 /NCGR_PEP_ID=MMETSP1319-20130603/6510_1 /TAXON_ID=172717 /ORGANISM="Bolidomonas pacifica, Strain RCC208" /LENGTH=319 /DNA_ID=CAMNT_0024661555 /DNA_START=489 /DNA_END=1448 /DNA_ORIENTATION=+